MRLHPNVNTHTFGHCNGEEVTANPHKSKGARTPMCFDLFLSTMEKKCLQVNGKLRECALHAVLLLLLLFFFSQVAKNACAIDSYHFTEFT